MVRIRALRRDVDLKVWEGKRGKTTTPYKTVSGKNIAAQVKRVVMPLKWGKNQKTFKWTTGIIWKARNGSKRGRPGNTARPH